MRPPTAASTTSPTSLSISTAHLERYLSVARQVTRLAVGLPPASPALETFEIPLHVLQDDRQSEDLPLGSRGGIAIHSRLSGRRRVPDQGSAAAAVSGLPQGHGLAAAARRPARRQAAEALHGRRRRARAGRPRPATPATASRVSPAIPSGKSTCRSAATPGSRSACRSRPGRTWSACRSCGRCGSRKACRSRCSAAASSPTTRSTWTTRTSARCRSAGRIASSRRRRKDTPSRRAIFVCQPDSASPKSAPARRRFSRRWRASPIGGR